MNKFIKGDVIKSIDDSLYKVMSVSNGYYTLERLTHYKIFKVKNNIIDIFCVLYSVGKPKKLYKPWG